MRGGGVWSWSNIDSSRSVIFPGFCTQQVEASYNGNTGQVFGEVALPLAHNHIAYEPFCGSCLGGRGHGRLHGDGRRSRR